MLKKWPCRTHVTNHAKNTKPCSKLKTCHDVAVLKSHVEVGSVSARILIPTCSCQTFYVSLEYCMWSSVFARIFYIQYSMPTWSLDLVNEYSRLGSCFSALARSVSLKRAAENIPSMPQKQQPGRSFFKYFHTHLGMQVLGLLSRPSEDCFVGAVLMDRHEKC